MSQCWRPRSRSLSQRSIFTPIVWIEDRENSASISFFNRDRHDRDLDLHLRAFPPRSNNAVVHRLLSMQVPLLHHRVSLRCMYHSCNVQHTMPRVVLCDRRDYTALLSVLVFSCEVSVVKHAACMPGYLEAVLVWGIPCLLHVVRCVSQTTAGMQVPLCMYDAHALNQI